MSGPGAPSPASLRIGVVCYPTFGGSGVVATELCRGLAERGHEIHLFSYAPPPRLDAFDQRIHLHEVEVSTYPLFKYPPYDLALASRLAEAAEAVPLDLIHVHYAIPHTLAAILVQDIVRPRVVPVVTTLHGTDITVVGADPSYERVTKYALGRSDRITAVSEYLRDRTREVFGVQRPIDVVPNFVDTERFRVREVPGIRHCFSHGGEHVLMHVSNFRPVKRAPLVVEAFAQVADAATLVMVGDGPERGACQVRARELGVATRVRFVGAQADVEHVLPAADVFLLPSVYESFGLAALEAMACGVVPVATDAGGLPEVIEHGVSGLLVPEPEIEAMGPLLTDLLGDPERLATMKAAARHAAVTRFGRDPVVARYEALYRETLTGALEAVRGAALSPDHS